MNIYDRRLLRPERSSAARRCACRTIVHIYKYNVCNTPVPPIHQVIWIVFTVINASLGFLISTVLVFNKRVYYAIKNRCMCSTTDSSAVVSTQVPKH